MKNTIKRILDLIAPRTCAVCGCRLTLSEDVICATCNLRLPRTSFSRNAYENAMARNFWVLLPIERAAALFFYEPHSQTSNIIYKLKYGGHPEYGRFMGRLAASEFMRDGFFEGIDIIVPVPLEKKRARKRGYNQSAEIAEGVSKATGLPLAAGALARTAFKDSQTDKIRWARLDNVEGVFHVTGPQLVAGRHVLLVDDIVTTGATTISCGQELAKAGASKISVMSLGFTRR